MLLKIERERRYEGVGKAGDYECLEDGFHNNYDHVGEVFHDFITERRKLTGYDQYLE